MSHMESSGGSVSCQYYFIHGQSPVGKIVFSDRQSARPQNMQSGGCLRTILLVYGGLCPEKIRIYEKIVTGKPKAGLLQKILCAAGSQNVIGSRRLLSGILFR